MSRLNISPLDLVHLPTGEESDPLVHARKGHLRRDGVFVATSTLGLLSLCGAKQNGPGRFFLPLRVAHVPPAWQDPREAKFAFSCRALTYLLNKAQRDPNHPLARSITASARWPRKSMIRANQSSSNARHRRSSHRIDVLFQKAVPVAPRNDGKEARDAASLASSLVVQRVSRRAPFVVEAHPVRCRMC
jgi:hypothetical protein